MKNKLIKLGAGLGLVAATAGCPDKAFASDSKLVDSLKAGAGIVAQIGAHQGGHYLGAKLTGNDIDFDSNFHKWDYEGNPSRAKRRVTSLSGFALPMGISEYLIQNDNFSKKNPFVKGAIIGPFLTNLAYVLADATGNYEGSDFDQLEKDGISKAISYPLVLVPSAFQAWRGLNHSESDKKSNWNLWSAPTNGGFAAGVTYKF